MRYSRTVTALLGLALSAVLTIGMSILLDAPFLLVFLPFLPLLGWRYRDRPETKSCPHCGFETREDAVQYCPYDGAPLETGE